MTKSTKSKLKLLVGGLVVVGLLVGGAFAVSSEDLQGKFKFGSKLSPLSPLSPIVMQPDLTISNIYLKDGLLHVEQENLNTKKATLTNGVTEIEIDGVVEWTYDWTTLSDTSFLSSHGSSTLTPQALSSGHKVKACIDTTDAVAEADEGNNCMKVSL